ncbi:protein-methionine-sulfoxide reductase heme-binding subunit MsrQ [Shimia aestuarii]|uniref:Protein-methionine-sulfoxide reductase heme-binding subunit MsrQ n=1 Tax=Shimia aestuarii TaxID=254406 RepID=A0A1I4S587_9RHOB|nr:protein-methionine-sulfoxide reductase heme-binding subunit MsrQ [Shimia aestuarii]SFM59665.1 sulfoxide reductase heme-binding subunit YedZ [Shimia aestuarii]
MIDTLNTTLRRVPPWSLYILAALYPAWLLQQGVTGGLGVDPVKAMEHDLGRRSLQLIVAGLCITPLRRFTGLNLVRFRRAVGLIAFFYICLHLTVWLVLDVQILSQVWADILKRPYITIGMAGFLLLVPLAVTSNAYSVRRLGRRWNRLHRLVYLAALLGAFHFVMLVKGFQYEPLIYLVCVIVLLLTRLAPRRRRIPT